MDGRSELRDLMGERGGERWYLAMWRMRIEWQRTKNYA